MPKLAIASLLTSCSLMLSVGLGTASGMKEAEKGYATRTLENGTNIRLVVGETVIPAVLNNSTTAKALIAKLPYTVQLNRYEHDYCGVMKDALPYETQDMRSGWHNGDISFSVSGNYFTILYKDEDISEQFDGIVNMGVLRAPLSVMDTLDQSISMKIELE